MAAICLGLNVLTKYPARAAYMRPVPCQAVT